MFRQKDFKLHMYMCMIGGFIGTYTLIRCSGHFGAAQTTNLIHAVESLVHLDVKEFLLCAGGFLAYMFGAQSYVLVTRKTSWNPQKWALIMEAIFLAVMGFIPADASFYFCLYPAFYILAAQWSAFHGTDSYNSSTIFSSNNVKQFSLALGECMCDRKNVKQAEKAKFFGLTLLSYHMGVGAAYICCRSQQAASIWWCYLLLGLAVWNVFGPIRKPVVSGQAVYRHRGA